MKSIKGTFLDPIETEAGNVIYGYTLIESTHHFDLFQLDTEWGIRHYIKRKDGLTVEQNPLDFFEQNHFQ